MFNTIDSDLIRGHIDTIILKALYEGDRYGFDIIKEVEQKSGGQYVIKQPTLYSCLKRLEVQGFIKSYWGTKSIGGRRKYFTLTDMGRELFTQNLQNWEYSRTVIDKLISDRYDTSLPPLNEAETAPSIAEQTENIIIENEEKADIFTSELEIENIVETEALSTNDTLNNEPSNESEFTDALTVEDEENDLTDPKSNTVLFVDEKSESYNNESSADIIEEGSENCSKPQQDIADSPNPYSEQNIGSLQEETSFIDEAKSESYVQEKQYREIDTDEILNRLYQQNSEDNSYVNTISNEKYTPSKIPAIDTNNYFTPLNFDEEAVDESQDTNVFVDSSNYTQDVAATNDSTKEKTTYSNNEFLSYHSPLNSLNFDEEGDEYIIERDYKKVLNALIEENTVSYSDYDTESLNDNSAPNTSISEFATERIIKNDFEKLVSSAKDMGDDITVKSHNSAELRKYSANHYFYCNQLRLYQYGILFALMLVQIATCFLIIELGIKSSLPIAKSDGKLYLFAVLVALAFPVYSIIMASMDFYKRKKYSFLLKSTVIFRIIVAIQFIVITYALNVYSGIITGNIYNYLSSLIMPSILSLNFIISPLIFNALFNTKKFAVK